MRFVCVLRPALEKTKETLTGNEIRYGIRCDFSFHSGYD